MKTDRHIDIMGIVNLTDDSYYAQSRCADVDAALMRIGRMRDEGADIIDIGACSTRPGSLPVAENEEWRRLRPVLSVLRGTFPDIRVSIDTTRASVVSRAYDLIGDFIVNDISAGEDDAEMLPLAGRLGLQFIAMHKRGTPLDMQRNTDYDDVTEEVISYFHDFALRAEEAGVRDWIADPGFGFAKTVEQNWQLLRDLDRIAAALGRRCLVGISRKSMITKPLGIATEDALPATQAAHMAALMGGAEILRVHDVAEAARTVTLFRMMA